MNALAIKGLKKAGDILLPGEGAFPRFSQTQLETQLPRLMNEMYAEKWKQVSRK